MSPLLEVKDLRTFFYTEYGVIKAVDGVSFMVEPGRTLGIVGESGCGKSVTALAIMGLIRPPGRIVDGEIVYHQKGKRISISSLDPKGKQMRSIRGNDIAMIFQEPMTSLNPVFTIGSQIMESITLHQHLNKKDAREKAIRILNKVGISVPEKRIDEYPHQLSGGMRQRAMIAMALSCNPSILIADEATTALDVTIQAQVVDLMTALQNEFGTSILMITHNLGLIAGMADDVLVMYLGRVVEHSKVRDVLHNPKHPYTQGLMESVISLASSNMRLNPIQGAVPDPLDTPPGCGFEPRCPRSMEVCWSGVPSLKEVAPGHWAACWLYE